MATGNRARRAGPWLALLAAAALAAPAGGQKPPGRPLQVRPGPALDAKVLIGLTCCDCLDGSVQSYPLDTRKTGWTVRVGTGTAVVAAVAASNAAWAAVGDAGWVSAPGESSSYTDYSYELSFDVPECFIGSAVTITGRFAADNRAAVFLDGTQLATQGTTISTGFTAANITNFTAANIPPGAHVLRVVVRNNNGVTGMALDGDITSSCPRNLER